MAHRYKRVVLLGDAGVGKTAIGMNMMLGRFPVKSGSTIGQNTFHINRILNGKQIEFDVIDTAGQERYRSLTPFYFTGASIVLLVFDVTNRSTAQNLDVWHSIVCQKGPSDVKFLTIGNKIDLIDSEESYFSYEAKEFADTHGHIPVLYTSAKKSLNVDSIVVEIGEMIKTHPSSVLYPSIQLGDAEILSYDSDTCC